MGLNTNDADDNGLAAIARFSAFKGAWFNAGQGGDLVSACPLSRVLASTLQG